MHCFKVFLRYLNENLKTTVVLLDSPQNKHSSFSKTMTEINSMTLSISNINICNNMQLQHMLAIFTLSTAAQKSPVVVKKNHCPRFPFLGRAFNRSWPVKLAAADHISVQVMCHWYFSFHFLISDDSSRSLSILFKTSSFDTCRLSIQYIRSISYSTTSRNLQSFSSMIHSLALIQHNTTSMREVME